MQVDVACLEPWIKLTVIAYYGLRWWGARMVHAVRAAKSDVNNRDKEVRHTFSYNGAAERQKLYILLQ